MQRGYLCSSMDTQRKISVSLLIGTDEGFRKIRCRKEERGSNVQPSWEDGTHTVQSVSLTTVPETRCLTKSHTLIYLFFLEIPMNSVAMHNQIVHTWSCRTCCTEVNNMFYLLHINTYVFNYRDLGFLLGFVFLPLKLLCFLVSKVISWNFMEF